MSDDFVRVEHDGDVTILRVDRPPANAMDPATLQQLVAAFRRLAAQPIKALVVTGRPGYFSAGVDLKIAPGLDAAGQSELVTGVNDLVLSSYVLPFPVVGAITGHAIAGGFVLAMCTDIRIAASAGKYGLTEVRVGVPYPAAAIGVVRAEVSASAARYLALGAGLVDANWCLSHGVFDEVLDGGAVEKRAIEVANELAQMPTSVYARTKNELRGQAQDWMRVAVDNDPLVDGWIDEEGRAAAMRALDRR